MNLCACCYDEATELGCNCEDYYTHTPSAAVIAEARTYIRSGRDLEMGESWTFYCTACDRYTSGTVYYTD